MSRGDRIPVTVLSGYLGAGKTTLVNHLLSNPGDRRIAVILNDMGEVNVDAEKIARENDEEGVVDLSNGCICCRLQDDLLSASRRASRSRYRSPGRSRRGPRTATSTPGSGSGWTRW